MIASVVGRIQNLGVEVEHILEGCTGLCQLVDTEVNKLLKNRIKERWESWMIQEGIICGRTSPPSHK